MIVSIQFWDEGETPPTRPQPQLLELTEDIEERRETLIQHFVETCGYDREGLDEEELENLELDLAYSEDHDATCDYQVQDSGGRHMFATIVKLPTSMVMIDLRVPSLDPHSAHPNSPPT